MISIVPLMSANMEVRLSDNGKILSIATDGTLNTPTFHRKKFFISRAFKGFNGLTGLSPLAFSAEVCWCKIAMEDNQREFFRQRCEVSTDPDD